MPTEILMPALSPTMEEGKLAKWLVKEGQQVKAGDIIAEIETDKATMEVEAVDEGKVGKLLVSEGTEGVKVNTPIAILLGDGESEASPSPRSRGEEQPEAQPPPVSASGVKAAPAAEAPLAAKSATGSPPHHAGGVSSTRRGEGLGVAETPTANVLRSPPPAPTRGRDKERRVPQRTGMAETAFLPRRWRADSPGMAGSILRLSPEAVRMGASSSVMWRLR